MNDNMTINGEKDQSEDLNILGTMVRKRRLELGMTVDQLAEQLYETDASISLIWVMALETGTLSDNPSNGIIEALADILKIDVLPLKLVNGLHLTRAEVREQEQAMVAEQDQQEREQEERRKQVGDAYQKLVIKPVDISMPFEAFRDFGILTLWVIQRLDFTGDLNIVTTTDQELLVSSEPKTDDERAAIEWIIECYQGLKTHTIAEGLENWQKRSTSPTFGMYFEGPINFYKRIHFSH